MNKDLPVLSNEQLVALAKGMITSAELASGGKLNPAQSNKFIDYVIEETVLAKVARMVRFRNEEAKIDKIGIAGRWVMVPAEEGTDPRFRAGVETSQVTLAPKDVICAFELTDLFKRRSIEGDAAEDTVVRLMAKQFANNLEMIYSNGNVLGPAIIEADFVGKQGSTTEYMKNITLGLIDGWLRRADLGHTKDFAGAAIGLPIFAEMLRQMPTKFRRRRQDLQFYMNPDLLTYYIESLQNRPTALGDAATSGITHTPFGVGISEVPLWEAEPEIVEHVQLNGVAPTSLKYKPVTDVVVTRSDLGKYPQAAYLLTADYTVDEANGTVTRNGAGAIGDGELVKVTYRALPQTLLTLKQNLIVAIGLDITIERDRNIWKRANEYAIHAAVDVQFEETDAVVKGENIDLAAAPFAPTP